MFALLMRLKSKNVIRNKINVVESQNLRLLFVPEYTAATIGRFALPPSLSKRVFEGFWGKQLEIGFETKSYSQN